MTSPQRWRQIRKLFDEAMEQPPESRSAWLARATDDVTLRREVARMLTAHDRAEGILEKPIHTFAARWIARAEADVEGTRQVGPFEVLEEIGRGGMGVVYKARDSRLDRFVALKFLPAHLRADPQAETRFLGEAKAASALDHRNICTIYDIGESEDGRLYIAMAYCGGPTLQQKIADGPLPLGEALDVAIQMAAGLECAHRAGITHRDIKPSNVIVMDGGEVKILDFGVAKPEGGLALTSPGTRIGTAAYMSPEQARGEDVDARTDLWALGVVLYEMVTGQRPFRAPSEVAVVQAILHEDPPAVTTLREDLPGGLDAILSTALAKSPADRYGRVEDLARDLKAVAAGDTSGLLSAAATRLDRTGNLPAQLSSFVGRDRERRQIVGLLDAVRLLTLTGPVGTGKTRLALQAASQASPAFEDGVFFVPLAPVGEPDRVPATIAQTLGVIEGSSVPVLTTLRHVLEGKKVLLVLDNFEQVAAAAPSVATLLEVCPGLTALVTSRVPLRISGEHEFAVPPLELPRAKGAGTVDELLESSAVRLFVERARAVRPDFTLEEGSAGAVAELCIRLDGLPLAIELAAARTKLFAPKALLSRLGRRLDLLKSPTRDRPGHHQTLRQAIAWSNDLLDEPERELFRRLAVFVGGFTLESAEAVAQVDPAVAIDVLDGVSTLVDQSLLRRAEGAEGEPRFSMLETLGEFALEALRASGLANAVRRGHAEHFLTQVENAEAELIGPDQARWLDWLDVEHDNLRAVFAWAHETGEGEVALRLGIALWRFWLTRGHVNEGCDRLERALAMEEASSRTAARARALNGLGTLLHNAGRNRAARSALEESLDIYRSLRDEVGAAMVLNNLAWVACELNDLATGESLAHEGLALNRRLGEKRGVAVALNNLGWVANYRGDTRAALEHHAASLKLRRQLGDQRNVGFALTNMAWAEQTRGNHERAQELAAEAHAILQPLGDKVLSCWTLCLRAAIAQDLGDFDRAHEIVERATPLWKEGGNRSTLASCLTLLGSIQADRGHLEEAMARVEEGLEHWRACETAWGMASALYQRGRVLALRGDQAGALETHREALAHRHAVGDRRGIADSLEAIAELDAEAGDLARAARLSAAASTLREEAGLPVPPSRRAGQEALVQRLRDAVGNEELERLRTEVRAEPLDQLVRELTA